MILALFGTSRNGGISRDTPNLGAHDGILWYIIRTITYIPLVRKGKGGRDAHHYAHYHHHHHHDYTMRGWIRDHI